MTYFKSFFGAAQRPIIKVKLDNVLDYSPDTRFSKAPGNNFSGPKKLFVKT